MTARIDYTVKEWEILDELPYLMGAAMIAVSRSGVAGKIKEAFSIISAASEPAKQFPDNLLIQELLSLHIEIENQERIEVKHGVQGKEEVVPFVLDRCRAAMSILEQKSTAQEAEEYKRWLWLAAEHVAKAAKSGSILGIGGKLIDDDEAAFLETLRETLGLPAQE